MHIFVARRVPAALMLVAAIAAAPALAARPQTAAFFPIDEVRPGMIGVGQTVFADGQMQEFKAHVIGVLRNTIGPRRDLVLARLEGGPLAQTGVAQGMSGSPVYIDGRLVGAVSYALGSFPREPLAGITPITEMIEAVEGGAGRTAPRGLSLSWPATETAVFSALRAMAQMARAPDVGASGAAGLVGPASLADLVPTLRPIGSAFVLGGFDPGVARTVSDALGIPPSARDEAQSTSAQATLRPGDPVGMSLLRGDIEMGATGTVTYVDGSRVYAFGHPFLNLGTTQLAMTRSHVFTVLPSLDTSMKIASLGPVIGTMGQDRATAVGGRLGAGPPELDITVRLSNGRGESREFRMQALHDAQLTPLFAFVALFNTLTSYERQNGALSLAARGAITFGDEGRVEIDDFYSGDGVVSQASSGLTAAIGAATTNDIRAVMPTKFEVDLRASESHDWATIERAWLDTTRPRAGATHTLTVQLRRYRGALEDITIPVTMPAKVGGPIKLLVADGATLANLERQELRPATKPSSWPALLAQLQQARAGNRVYVRLLTTSGGTVVAGEPMPSLPHLVRSALEADPTVAQAPVSRTVLGAWERRLERAVRGSRELTLTLDPQ